VGKSTLIKSLVKHYTRHNLSSVKGPITVVSGKQRRLQLVECGPELNNMARAHPGAANAVQPSDFCRVGCAD
jgi:ribosome biogenesis protein BMS1